jgi:hypothetical protein
MSDENYSDEEDNYNNGNGAEKQNGLPESLKQVFANKGITQ